MSEGFRVLVADDHPLFRQGVIDVLSAEADILVISEAATGEDALRKARETLPDLIVIDLDMPGKGGVATIKDLAAECPASGILVLTVSEDPVHLMEALRNGAKGYVLKGVSAPGLIHAVRVVLGGDAYVSPALAGAMLYEMTHGADDPVDTLSEREREVLELLADGLTNKEIGERLFLAEKTVKHYMSNVLQKLHLRSRVEAALLAQRRRLEAEGFGAADA